MSAITRNFAAALLIIAAVGCGGGNNGNGGGMGVGAVTMTNIGPGGGQAVSADGTMTIVFPAGAVAQSTMITITTLGPADFSPSLASVSPDVAYAVEPEMVLGAPAEVRFDALDIPEAGFDNQPILAPGIFQQTTGNSVFAVLGCSEIDADALTHTSIAMVTELGRFAASNDLGFGGPSVTVDYPQTIPEGQSDSVSVTVGVGSVSPGWSAVSTGVDDDLSETPVPFNGNSPGKDTFNITCPPGATGGTCTVSVITTEPVTVLDDFGMPMTDFAIRSVKLTFSVQCGTGGTGPGLAGPVVYDLGALNMSSIEAARPVPPGVNCIPGATAGDPHFIIAGRSTNPGFGSAAKIINPLEIQNPAGTPVVATFPLGAAPGTAFDAHYLTGNGIEAVNLTGSNEGLFTEVLPGCQLPPFQAFSFGFHEDTNAVADRTDATVSAVGAGIRFSRITPSGLDVGPSYILPNGARSAVSNPAMTHVVTLEPGGLRFSELDGAGGVVATMIVDPNVGNNPRRIDWDPASGVFTFSIFDDDQVKVGLWDGQNPPSITDTGNCADGPVGGSIRPGGTEAFYAGFNDDQYTTFTIDPVTGIIQSSVTQPIPATPLNGGMFNPGHAAINGDVLAFGNFGDDSVTFIPVTMAP